MEILDCRIDADGAEHPAGHRVEEGLRQLGIRAGRREAGVLRLHGGPDRPLHDPVFQDVVDVGHRRVDMGLVERQPLRRVGLSPGPVAPLETALGPAGDLLEAALVLLVGRMNGGHGRHDRTKGCIAVHSSPDQIERRNIPATRSPSKRHASCQLPPRPARRPRPRRAASPSPCARGESRCRPRRSSPSSREMEPVPTSGERRNTSSTALSSGPMAAGARSPGWRCWPGRRPRSG